ncbi:drug/metabolite transporter (DMT)-like permease [Neorhizobium huautlense]|uniref:Drug/metabolite transporter (DMT)-like permease n=1 Tax=Neorhizobium huautlense TaxID=67774 RepID=A0ABT9PSD2_9HYPH|nr:DMT family transporter [Neorhizobium huautlense]MDP9836634.1 drug/metabolite transporter (DMT)-like permease [Neorhizobium huautlense]
MATVSADHALKGVLIAFASFAAFAFSDASVKLLEGTLSPYQASFLGAIFGAMALPFIMKPGDRWTDIFATTNRPLWILRFAAQAGGTIGSVTAFTHLSMAEAFALIFLLPSFVTIMSVLFLKEKVGFRRWGAVIIGFVGVMIVLRPGFRELSIGHLGAVFGGLSGAISIVIFRAMGPSEKNISLYGAGVLGTLVVCGALAIPGFQVPTMMQWVWLAGYGGFAAIAAILLMYAAAYAPATLIGPTQYSQMLWAVLFGYLVFGDTIDLPMMIGILLIVGSGLMTLMRERVRGTPLPPSIGTDAQAAAMVSPEEPSEQR